MVNERYDSNNTGDPKEGEAAEKWQIHRGRWGLSLPLTELK